MLSEEVLLKFRTQAMKPHHNRHLISAKSDLGIENLLNTLDQYLSLDFQIIKVQVGNENGKEISWLYRNGEIVTSNQNHEILELTVKLSKTNFGRFYQMYTMNKSSKFSFTYEKR